LEANLNFAADYAKKFFNAIMVELQPETPERFTKMMMFLTEFQNISNAEITEMVNKVFPVDSATKSESVVIVRDIEVFSLCEHHIALIYDAKISVAYVPNGFVLGLSKISRIAEMVCKRLQLQEKIGEDIIEIMNMLTKSSGVAVKIVAKHSCVTARGVRNVSSKTVTFTSCGILAGKNNIFESL
jgi:GTP cyclohydrolase I